MYSSVGFWQQAARNWKFGMRWQIPSTPLVRERYLNPCSSSKADQQSRPWSFSKSHLVYLLIIKTVQSVLCSMATTVTASWIGRPSRSCAGCRTCLGTSTAGGNCRRLGVAQILRRSFKLSGTRKWWWPQGSAIRVFWGLRRYNVDHEY